VNVGDVLQFKEGRPRPPKHWLDQFGGLGLLQKFDIDHHTSLVRSLEMTLDGFAFTQGYVIQFFQDFRTYGLREAVTYATNYALQAQGFHLVIADGRKFLDELAHQESLIRWEVTAANATEVADNR
jgi:hypothetical protein